MPKSINPANQEILRVYPEMSDQQVGQIVLKAHQAFLDWRITPLSFRKECLLRLAQELRSQAPRLAREMAMEMGKPLKAGLGEVEKCAWNCDYFALHGEKFLQEEIIETEDKINTIAFAPLGVILGIMPWNFPFWQFFRFAVPALMAGNTCLLKHASNVTGCALLIEELFQNAGFPTHVVQTLILSSSRIEHLIEDPRVQGLALTGSVAAGKAVAKKAGEEIKKLVLELGGSDPYLIFEDADLPLAAKMAVTGRMLNSGQSCIAAKRFIVIQSVSKKFEELCLQEIKALRVGDPLLEDTDLGPLSSLQARDELHAQVEKCLQMGAKCLVGGKKPIGKGAYYPPTLLTQIKKGMPAYHEEIFGPVACLITVDNEEEAVQVANDTVFGLGAGIFTKDLKRAERLAKDSLEVGNCFINDFVKSDPRLPFGGIKQSGYGRELSAYGIKEFVNIKAISLPKARS